MSPVPGQTPQRADRFPVGLTIATLIAFALAVGLGVWQIKRLAWKTTLLAQVEQAKTGPALPLDQVLALPNPAFHRVTLECAGLASAPYVEIHAIVDGEPGRRLVSACPQAKGAILVDRGFLGETTNARPPVTPDGPSVTVTGVLLAGAKPGPFTPPPSGRLFFSHNVPAMAQVLGVAGAGSYFVAAESSTNPELGALRAIPLPSDIPNNHFQYALTWFGLAAALLAIYAAKLTPWLRARSNR